MLDNTIIEAVKFQANLIGVDEATLLAVVDVESGGTPFWEIGGVNKPVIRFEGHYFYARLKGKARTQAVQAGLASPKVGGVPNPSSASSRYQLLDRAKAIDPNAALESTSWGLGQVMGANWKDLGRNNVTELVNDSNTLTGQIDLMTDFIEFNGLTDKLRKKDWEGFAKGYNGSAYKKNDYANKLKKAYVIYSKVHTDDIAEDEIRQLQTMLNSVIKAKLEVDGSFGPQTKASLRDFQIKYNLTVDGLYGPLTKTELEKQYKAKANSTVNTTGISAASVGTAGTMVSEAAKSIQGMASASGIIQIIFVVLLLVGIGLTVKATLFK